MRKKHRLPFPILFEDEDLIVVDKPAGLLTTHTKLVGRLARESQLTAENILNDYVRKGQAKSKKRVWLVHRLDRETSGVMMFAKSEEVAEKFRADWANLTEKTYRARVAGLSSAPTGRTSPRRHIAPASRDCLKRRAELSSPISSKTPTATGFAPSRRQTRAVRRAAQRPPGLPGPNGGGFPRPTAPRSSR